MTIYASDDNNSLHDTRSLHLCISFGNVAVGEEAFTLGNSFIDWVEEHFGEEFVLDWRGIRAAGPVDHVREEIRKSFNPPVFSANGGRRTPKMKSLAAYRKKKKEVACLEFWDPTCAAYFEEHFLRPHPTNMAIKEAFLQLFSEPNRIGYAKRPPADLEISFRCFCRGDFCTGNLWVSCSLEAIGDKFDDTLALLRTYCESIILCYPETNALITVQSGLGIGDYLYGQINPIREAVVLDPFYTKQESFSPSSWYFSHLISMTGTEHWVSAYTRQYLPKGTSFEGLTYRELPNGGFHVAIPKSPIDVDVADFAVMKNALYDIYLPRYRCHSYEEIYSRPTPRHQWGRFPVFREEITVSHKRVMFSHYPRKSDWAVRVFGPLPELWEDDWL